MILIPEQVMRINKKIGQLEKSLSSYAGYYADKNAVGAGNSPRSQIGDVFTEHNLALENEKLDRYRDVLKNNDFLYNRNYDNIGVGTKFNYCFEEAPEEIEEGVLADSMIGLSSHEGFISSASTLGEAVLGKKIGDVCIFYAADDFQAIRIVDIVNNPKKYVNFIRRIPYGSRRTDLSRVELADERKNNPLEYTKRKNITLSQREMLMNELERISACINVNNADKLKRRAAEIKGYLKTRKLAEPVLDDSIGVGTKFTVMFVNKDGSETVKELEMINVALSDELDSDYVERISSLGMAVFGLKEGEEFTLRVNGVGKISGYVYNIKNEKVDTNTVKTSQYLRK